MEKDVDVEGELVPCLTAPLADARELQSACEAAEIPAFLSRGSCCGQKGCGCAPRMQLMVAKEDVERVAHLLDQRWKTLLAREGTIGLDDDDGDGGVKPPAAAAAGEAGESEHPPCPACGTAAPLVAGACADCGLQLE
jgi:hypothetical protein